MGKSSYVSYRVCSLYICNMRYHFERAAVKCLNKSNKYSEIIKRNGRNSMKYACECICIEQERFEKKFVWFLYRAKSKKKIAFIYFFWDVEEWQDFQSTSSGSKACARYWRVNRWKIMSSRKIVHLNFFIYLSFI